MTVSSAAENSAPAVFLDGKQLVFEVEPQIIDGSTLVPLRKIFESLGAKVEWEQETKTVTAVKDSSQLLFQLLVR